MVKNPPANAEHKRDGFDSWVGKIPWNRKWQTTAEFLVANHGQRSLAGYSPWGCKELDATKVTYTHTHVSISTNVLPSGDNTMI